MLLIFCGMLRVIFVKGAVVLLGLLTVVCRGGLVEVAPCAVATKVRAMGTTNFLTIRVILVIFIETWRP